jgi:hypothetical protein
MYWGECMKVDFIGATAGCVFVEVLMVSTAYKLQARARGSLTARGESKKVDVSKAVAVRW